VLITESGSICAQNFSISGAHTLVFLSRWSLRSTRLLTCELGIVPSLLHPAREARAGVEEGLPVFLNLTRHCRAGLQIVPSLPGLSAFVCAEAQKNVPQPRLSVYYLSTRKFFCPQAFFTRLPTLK